MYSKKATAFNLQSKYWLTCYFSSNFWKRCGKSIKGWAKLRTWLRRRRSRKKEKKPHYSVLLDIYLNNFTWLGWFVREIDSHRTRNIQTYLKKNLLCLLEGFFCGLYIKHKQEKHKKKVYWIHCRSPLTFYLSSFRLLWQMPQTGTL